MDVITPLKKTPPPLELSHISLDSNYGNYANQSPPADKHGIPFGPQSNLAETTTADYQDSNTMPFMVSPSQVPMPSAAVSSSLVPSEDLVLSSGNDSDSNSSGSESSSSSSDSDDSSGEEENTEADTLTGEHHLNTSLIGEHHLSTSQQTNEDLVLFNSPVNSPMSFDEEMGFGHLSQDPQVTHLFGALPSEDPPTGPQLVSTPQPPVGVSSHCAFQPQASADMELPCTQTEKNLVLSGTQTNVQEPSNITLVESEPKTRSSRDTKRLQLAVCNERPGSGLGKPKMGEEPTSSGQLIGAAQVAGKKRKWAEPSVPSTSAPLKAPRLHRYNSVESNQGAESTMGEAPSTDTMGNGRTGMESEQVLLESDLTLMIKIPLTLVKKKRMATVEPYHVTAPSEKASRRRSEGQESIEEVWGVWGVQYVEYVGGM